MDSTEAVIDKLRQIIIIIIFVLSKSLCASDQTESTLYPSPLYIILDDNINRRLEDYMDM